MDQFVMSRRRSFLRGAGALSLGWSATALRAQSKAPLKIGVLNTFSKSFAVLGNANLNGMNLYFEQQGGVVAGRRIQIIKEDDEVNPQVGLHKLRKLVEADEVDIVTGIQASNVALAVLDYLRQSRAFFLCSGAGGQELGYTNIPYLFRCSLATGPVHRTMGDWFYDNVAKDVVTSASDFSGGRETVADFKAAFVNRGGVVVKEIYPPLGTSDFSAYLGDIKRLKAAATFAFYGGTDAVRFVKQYDEFGLKASTQLTGSGFLVEADALPSQGKSALGVMSALHYSNALDTVENKKFVADYFARYQAYPSVISEHGYVAAAIISEALAVVDGNTKNKDRLRDAMLAIRMNAPRGPFRFNPATQGPVHNVYIREVAEVNGRLTNKVIKTYPNVGEPATKQS